MGRALSKMQLNSPAFKNLGKMPRKYTQEGENISPSLEWDNVPEGTQSFALFCHDPDAPRVSPGTYGSVHWVLYNIPSSVSKLSEGTKNYTRGVNEAQQDGYRGPMPPEEHGIHHYFFWLLALNVELHLEPGLSLWQLLKCIEPNVIGMNRIVGIYKR